MSNIRERMELYRQFLYDWNRAKGALKSQEETILDIVSTMNRRASSATIKVDVYLQYARTDELSEVCADVGEMIVDV